jgi:hypothetical protein
MIQIFGMKTSYHVSTATTVGGPGPSITLNFYFPGGFEKVVTDFGVAATSRTLPPANLQQPGTPEQMQALFQRVDMSPVALPDSLRKLKSP